LNWVRKPELRGEFLAGTRELDLEFGGFPRAEEQVGDESSGYWGNEPFDLYVLLSVFLSDHFLVNILEDLIEAEFAEPMCGVSDEGRGPSDCKLSIELDFGDAVAPALAESRVELFLALHDVEGTRAVWISP
jgi:hypothetical protein